MVGDVGGNFLAAVAQVVNIALTIYMWVIIARAVLSWVNPDPHNTIVQIIYRLTEPLLSWVRSKIWRLQRNMGGLDLSPIIVLLAIYFLKAFVVQSLFDIARNV